MKQYLLECWQLLGWSFFKPYTLDRHLSGIHPELDKDSNPFSLRDEFDTNQRLKRYAGQAWWLAVIMPMVAVLLIAPFYNAFWPAVELAIANAIPTYEPVIEQFDWQRSGRFIGGWIAGL